MSLLRKLIAKLCGFLNCNLACKKRISIMFASKKHTSYSLLELPSSSPPSNNFPAARAFPKLPEYFFVKLTLFRTVDNVNAETCPKVALNFF